MKDSREATHAKNKKKNQRKELASARWSLRRFMAATSTVATAYAVATATAALPYAVAAGEIAVAAGETAVGAIAVGVPVVATAAATAGAALLQGAWNIGGLVTGRLEVTTDADGNQTIIETGRAGGDAASDTLEGLGP
jgi:hypothetical protein